MSSRFLLFPTDDDRRRPHFLNLDQKKKKKKKKKKKNTPTVMIFKDGEKKDVVIGAVPKSTLVQTLEKYID